MIVPPSNVDEDSETSLVQRPHYTMSTPPISFHNVETRVELHRALLYKLAPLLHTLWSFHNIKLGRVELGRALPYRPLRCTNRFATSFESLRGSMRFAQGVVGVKVGASRISLLNPPPHPSPRTNPISLTSPTLRTSLLIPPLPLQIPQPPQRRPPSLALNRLQQLRDLLPLARMRHEPAGRKKRLDRVHHAPRMRVRAGDAADLAGVPEGGACWGCCC